MNILFDPNTKADRMMELLRQRFGIYNEDKTYAAQTLFSFHDLYRRDIPEEFIVERVAQMVEKSLLKTMLPYWGQSMFVRTLLETLPMNETTWDNFGFRAITSAQICKEKPVIYKIVHEVSELPTNVFECEFCKGFTYNDARGNCSACGAPRSRKAFGRIVNTAILP